MTPGREGFSLGQASRRWWLVLTVLVVATVLVYRTRGPATTALATTAMAARLEGSAQGTTYRIVLDGPRAADSLAVLQAAVDSLLAVVDATMSTYDRASELSRLNRDARTSPIRVSAMLAGVLRAADDVSRASGGAFDVTVGPLVDAWGFGPPGEPPSPPSDSLVSALRERVGWDKLVIDSASVTKRHADMEIDLNAIAPGYSVDLLSQLLTARGEPNHLIELGGEVRVSGHNAASEPFRVGIEDPVPEGRTVHAVVGLTDRALATSGNYRDFRDVNGVRYVHTLDPSTGRPVTHHLLSVSVLHERCALADAWATALLVVGPERAWALAAANGLDVLLLVAGPDGQLVERMTDGFAAARLRDPAVN